MHGDLNMSADDALTKATHIWTHPQFLVADVCKITGITPKALEHFIKRDLVRLIGPHANPGSGRRRVFSGGDVLMIAAAYAMSRIGFPQRFSRTLAETVKRRAINRSIGATFNQTDLVLATYPNSDGSDWIVIPLYNEKEEEPNLPVSVQLLNVDRLIDEVHAQLVAIVADEEVPDFSVPDPKPEPNPFSPASNFFRSWEKSKSGRWVYVGLTEEETDELLAMQGIALDGDELVIVNPDFGSRDRDERDRYLELHEKHERERLKRCGMALRESDD